MRIVHPYYFDPISIEDTEPETLIIEDNKYFRRIVFDLLEQVNTDIGEFVLSEDNDLLSISKNCLMLTDPFNLDFENRQFKNKLNQAILHENTDSNYYSLITQINMFGSDICNRSRFPIVFNTTLGLQDLVKWMDFRIDIYQLSQVDQISEFINLCSELLSKNLIITVGLKDVLNYEEYFELEKMIKYKHIRMLLLEHRTHTFDDIKHLRIIDEDLCVI